MKVELSQRALRDLLDISAYLEVVSDRAAERIIRQVHERCGSLESNPRRGTRLRLPYPGEYRRLIEGPYVIIYRVDPARVLVARVIHGARNVDALLNDPAFTASD